MADPGSGKVFTPDRMLCGSCGAEFEHPPRTDFTYSTELPTPSANYVGGIAGCPAPVCPKCGNTGLHRVASSPNTGAWVAEPEGGNMINGEWVPLDAPVAGDVGPIWIKVWAEGDGPLQYDNPEDRARYAAHLARRGVKKG